MIKVFEVPSAERDAEAIYDYVADTGDSPYLVDWSPGNGTRYRVMFVPLTADLVKASGFGFAGDGSAWLVTWVIPGEACQSYIFTSGGHLDWSYVKEKLCFKRGSNVDASELTRIIGHALRRRPVGLCTGPNGDYVDCGDYVD